MNLLIEIENSLPKKLFFKSVQSNMYNDMSVTEVSPKDKDHH